MVESKDRIGILSVYLNFAFALNVVTAIVCVVLLFWVEDTCSIYATSICAASALFNSVGLTLLMRWHRSGAFLVIGTSLLSAVTFSYVCTKWYLGTLGLFIPYIVFILYVSGLLALLNFKVRGKTAWQQMDAGLDIAHFRHIYQLSVAILITIAIVAFFKMPQEIESGSSRADSTIKAIENVSEKRLDSPDIVIEEIISFEREYNKKYVLGSRDEKISMRIFALKHLLLSGLMPDLHSGENLKNICVVHMGQFSLQQQEILDWYLSLDVSQQAKWDICEKATSISDFNFKLRNYLDK